MRRTNIGLALYLIPVAVLAACNGDDGSGPPVPTQVVVSPGSATLTVTGSTVQFTAQALDENGNAISGLAVTWSSNPLTVATVDSLGVATAVGPGTAEIRATAGGVVGSAALSVSLTPSELLKTAGDEQVGAINTILPIRPRVRVTDAAGSPIPGVSVAFQVVEGGGTAIPASITTGSDGTASTQWTLGGVEGAPQRLRASAGALTVDFTASAGKPLLTVTTTTLKKGRLTISYSETLEATGGSNTGYAWSVAGGDVPPGLAVHPAGVIDGTPAQDGTFFFTVQVEDSEGETATANLSLRVCEAPLALAPGEVEVLDPSDPSGCGFFLPSGSAGDRYRVGIVRTKGCATGQACNAAGNDVASATLSVEGVGTLPSPEMQAHRAASPGESVRLLSVLEEDIAIAEATEAFHLQLREAERDVLESLGPEVRPLPSRAVAGAPAGPSLAAPQKRLFHFPVDASTCEEGPLRTALLVGENELIAIYQDSIQQVSTPVNAEAVQAMLDHYRDHGKEIIEDYFGGTTDINSDGQIVVYVTPQVPNNVAAFVWSGDFFSTTSCANSNEMEITYFDADVINSFEEGRYQQVGTLVHEVKHVSSLYNRVRGNDILGFNFHPPWVEEGTAEIAADRASRLAWFRSGGPPVGAAVTLEDWQEAGGFTLENYHTVLKMARTVWYLSSQPNAVSTDPLGAQSGHSIYGGGWHFHRFLGDAYANAASAFADTTLFRTQNDSLTTPGPDAYPTLIGRTFSQLMEEYAAAVMLNGTGAPQPERAFTSFIFPESAEIFSQPDPPGVYPWPVTTTASENESVPLVTATYSGPMGESGLRVHDFLSNGTGEGAEISVDVAPPARVVVVRLR